MKSASEDASNAHSASREAQQRLQEALQEERRLRNLCEEELKDIKENGLVSYDNDGSGGGGGGRRSSLSSPIKVPGDITSGGVTIPILPQDPFDLLAGRDWDVLSINIEIKNFGNMI